MQVQNPAPAPSQAAAPHPLPQYGGGKVHLCPMHKHKLAISATNLYRSERLPEDRQDDEAETNIH